MTAHPEIIFTLHPTEGNFPLDVNKEPDAAVAGSARITAYPEAMCYSEPEFYRMETGTFWTPSIAVHRCLHRVT